MHPLLRSLVLSPALSPRLASPFLRTLLPSVGLAYAIQAAVAVPSIALQSERFYDLSGSFTYLSCAALSLALPTLRARAAASAAGKAIPAFPSVVEALTKGVSGGAGGAGVWTWRNIVLSAAVGLWAGRLGTYLFTRILGEGKDSRFDDMRQKPLPFAGAFLFQAAWISFCLLPVLALNSLPAAQLLAPAARFLPLTDVAGVGLYVLGFAFEAVADAQKSRWMREKNEKKHEEKFITSGLWGKSRHPNYFGEIALWCGIATAAGGVLGGAHGIAAATSLGLGAARAVGWGMAAVSPAFVTFLLTQVSGIPMSENKYDERYKDDAKYQEWKKNTPMLFPKL